MWINFVIKIDIVLNNHFFKILIINHFKNEHMLI